MKSLRARLEKLEKHLAESDDDDGKMTVAEWKALHGPGGALDLELDITEEEHFRRSNEYEAQHHPASWERNKERILKTQREILEVMAIFSDEFEEEQETV